MCVYVCEICMNVLYKERKKKKKEKEKMVVLLLLFFCFVCLFVCFSLIIVIKFFCIRFFPIWSF